MSRVMETPGSLGVRFLQKEGNQPFLQKGSDFVRKDEAAIKPLVPKPLSAERQVPWLEGAGGTAAAAGLCQGTMTSAWGDRGNPKSEVRAPALRQRADVRAENMGQQTEESKNRLVPFQTYCGWERNPFRTTFQKPWNESIPLQVPSNVMVSTVVSLWCETDFVSIHRMAPLGGHLEDDNFLKGPAGAMAGYGSLLCGEICSAQNDTLLVV